MTVADLPWGKIDVDGLETKAERIRLQIERIESDPELAQLQDELKQLLRQKDDEGKNRYRAEAELENVQHAVQAEQAWLDMHGDSDFDDAALSDMVSNLLADTYETCFDTSRPQERPQRIAGGFDREGTAPFDVRVLRRIGNTELLTSNFTEDLRDFYDRQGQYRKLRPLDPTVTFDEDQLEMLNLWGTPMTDTVNAWTCKFAMNQADINNDWDTYVAGRRGELADDRG